MSQPRRFSPWLRPREASLSDGTVGVRTLVSTGLLVAGVDEAGRGPLAGPVVAAAVILDPARPIAGLRDSKALSAERRERLAHEIRARASCFALGQASVAEIDTLNILRASLLAMERAVLKLRLRPDLLRVDGNQTPRFEQCREQYRVDPIVGGDRSEPAISAASILAKVCRDRLLARLHRKYPHYGFDRHKGYPTGAHLAALAQWGPCAIHRRTFAPVRQIVDGTIS
jgi:ribonuclease HII